MASHNILLGYDQALSKLSHVELIDNALKVTDNNLSKLTETNTALGDIKAELIYANNSINPTSIAHSHLLTHTKLDEIKAEAIVNQTKINSTNAELAYANNTGTVGAISHSLVNILSQVIAMGAVPTKSMLDFETDYVSIHSETIVLENHKTGQYHIIGDDATIKQFKLIQMGEMGSPTYTVTIKVYSVVGGVANLQSTNNYTGIAPTSILGMNAINYLTNQPTTTGLVCHFPFDYSLDCVKNSGITMQGGSLVKQPKVGFRSYSFGGRAGCYTSVFDLASYANNWTICFWFKVINQDPTNTYLRLLGLYDTMHDDSDEKFCDGFAITLNNQTSYNTKPYDDYRLSAYDATGTKINLISATASGGSGTGDMYFAGATGKYMNMGRNLTQSWSSF